MTIRTDRPRLFFVPETLTAKKAEAAANVPRWKSLKAVTQAAFTETSKDWIPNLALCYVITGDAKYARRAYALLKLVTDKGMAPFIADSGKPAGELMLYAALVYDWCNDQLTGTEAINLAARMQAWEDWIWAPREKPWGVDAPWDNYFHGFTLATWLYGLSVGVDGAVNLARDKWLNRALPWLQAEAAGGFMHEGSNYGTGSLVSILMQLAAHKTATGEELRGDLVSGGWAMDAINAKVHQTAPDFIAKAPFGDQASAYPARHSDTDRLAMMFCTLPRTARFWLDTIKPNLNTRGQDFWQEFLFYPNGTIAFDYTSAPIALHFTSPGVGYLSTRSGWERDAVQVQAVCGKTFSTHQDAAGTFVLCRGGDWLIGHAKQWSASGIHHGAEFVNCITVDGRGQDNMQDRTARVTFVDDSAKRTIWQMEAGQAYDYSVTSSNRVKPLKSWRRTLVFLKPGVLIVHDRVEKNDPKSVVTLPINTHRVFNAQLGLTEGASDLYVTAVKPNGTPAMRGMLLGSGGALSSYQTIFQNPLGQAVDEFLMVYQVGANGFTPMPVTRTGSAARVGDDEAIFHEDGTVEMVDHRVIPSVEAMWSLWRAVEKWADTEADSDIPAAVAAAKKLLEVVNV